MELMIVEINHLTRDFKKWHFKKFKCINTEYYSVKFFKSDLKKRDLQPNSQIHFKQIYVYYSKSDKCSWKKDYLWIALETNYDYKLIKIPDNYGFESKNLSKDFRSWKTAIKSFKQILHS